MSPIEARRILDALAEGLDPISGQALADDHALHQPKVVRALFMAGRALSVMPTPGESPPAPPASAVPESDAAAPSSSSSSSSSSSPPSNARERRRPPNAGKPWLPAEDEELAAAFDTATASSKDLAASHGRSVGAIRSRLLRLGRLMLAPDGETMKPTGERWR